MAIQGHQDGRSYYNFYKIYRSHIVQKSFISFGDKFWIRSIHYLKCKLEQLFRKNKILGSFLWLLKNLLLEIRILYFLFHIYKPFYQLSFETFWKAESPTLDNLL